MIPQKAQSAINVRNFDGTFPERVIELLQKRCAEPSALPRRDGRKLGLIVEGGGMRGVLSAGSLLALDLLGFRQCFDVVYAVSAGSVNAAYFLSGQGAKGITIYFDNISCRRFINPWRVWKIVDVDFVYDELLANVKPLDEEQIRMCPQEFYVTATDVQTGEGVLLDAKREVASIARFLKASSALPVLYNRSVDIDGRSYMDGGVAGGLPVNWAVAQGCTDLFVLLSQPSTYVHKGPRLFERLIFRAMVGFRYPAMYASLLKASTTWEKNRRLAIGIECGLGLNIATLCPDFDKNGIGRTTIDRNRLVRGAYLNAKKVFDSFGRDRTELDRLFKTFC